MAQRSGDPRHRPAVAGQGVSAPHWCARWARACRAGSEPVCPWEFEWSLVVLLGFARNPCRPLAGGWLDGGRVLAAARCCGCLIRVLVVLVLRRRGRIIGGLATGCGPGRTVGIGLARGDFTACFLAIGPKRARFGGAEGREQLRLDLFQPLVGNR